jgi:predicted metal-dependent phosphoesterase TrpH
MGFAELSITSNFSFLTGGAHPEEYARRAAMLGIEAIAIADENSVAGIVRAWSELKEIKRQIAARQAADHPLAPPLARRAAGAGGRAGADRPAAASGRVGEPVPHAL